MKHQLPTVLLVLILLLQSAFTGGCTIWGYLVGSEFDRDEAAYDTVSIGRNTELKEESTLLVLTKDSAVYCGEFLGWENELTPEYQERYRDWRAEAGDRSFVPALGDSINLRIVRGGEQKVVRLVCRLAGFSRTGVLVIYHESLGQKQDEMQSIELSLIDSISYGHGESLSGESIHTLLWAEIIPSTTHLRISQAESTFPIPRDSVREIRWVIPGESPGGNYAGLGGGIGMAIDIAIIIALANAYEHAPTRGFR